ncbi:3-deoxy-D-manno-octulosonic acid transferase [Stieleria sp. TO1_6]|uniref:3-deoxy-D-manno-octulosonic acid transferase n=1 Tax=Stieleria tagensis TaxID=2956795 RepID=UPI00209B7436|nr:3-deoxy-D-manno-octulosonic acid transferase [Stieleria tagensis]MCO8122750.1 3-deoxy-D-manno-octulosonic acid transferase [Stieleria tagensis]
MIANVLYLFALAILSPWILYRRLRHDRYRLGWQTKLFGLSANHASRLRESDRCIWLHAVSVGEVNLLGGIIDRLNALDPDLEIAISSSTDSGYQLAVQRFGDQRVFFCPLDFTWAVRRTLRNLKPAALVLAELELWPNLIRIAKQQDVKTIVINGRLSDRSAAGYQRFGFLTQSIFQSLDQVECQDDASAKNFIACGTPAARVSISGSLKFDDAPHTRDCVEVHSRARWAGVDPWHAVWVVGSTQEGEEQMAIDIYRHLRQSHQELRLVLVPRHPERFDRVAKLIASAGLISHRRSVDASLNDVSWDPDRVILVDTIGELRHWWGVGHIATVGGSFGDRGGQNMLEPAGYGSAISFGPNTRNFADITRRLLDAHGAVRVHDIDQLQAFVERCLTDVPAADALGRSAKSVVEQHRGATDRTVTAIANLIGLPATPKCQAA